MPDGTALIAVPEDCPVHVPVAVVHVDPFVDVSILVVVDPIAAAHVSVIVALPATAVRLATEHGTFTVGLEPVTEHTDAGGATMLTTEDAPAPAAVLAVTRNRYTRPAVRPVAVKLVPRPLLSVSVSQFAPPSEDCSTR